MIQKSIPQHNKYVSQFCYEKGSPLYRICIQIKKKLYIYEYIGSFQFIKVILIKMLIIYKNKKKEIVLPEPALSIEWFQNTLCLGFKKEYALIDLDTEVMISLFPLDKSQPLFKLLDNNELLLIKDGFYIY